MNSISWYIYFANVFDNLSNVLGLLSIVFLVLTIIGTILCVIVNFDDSASAVRDRPKVNKLYAIVLALFVFFGLGFIFTPDKQTSLMIAGSQLTQQVANTPQAQELLNHLKTIIDKKLAELEK